MYITGIDTTKVRTSAEGAEFKVGALGAVIDSSGRPRIYMYCTTSAACTAGYAATINNALASAAMASVSNTAPGAGQGRLIGIPPTAVASGGFGWFQVYGVCSVRVAASCAIYTILNSTGTTGVLDDDATAGAEVIEGLVITTSPGGAEASVAGFLTWPYVGRTLP